MKVVFLDLDGLFNSERTRVAFGGYPSGLAPADVAMFDQVALGLVRGILRAAGASAVLSSSWRIDHDWGKVGQTLGLPFIGATPSLMHGRGAEIAKWLAEHPDVETYAIVDDHDEMLDGQRSRFVHCSGFEGFAWRDAVQLSEILGIKVYDAFPARRLPAAPKLGWE